MSEKLQKILEEIKLGKIKDTYNFSFSLDEYLSKDENGVSFLEHLLKNNIDIYFREEEKFKNSIEVAYIYLKYNKTIWGFEFNEYELFSYINGERFIEVLLKNNELSSSMLESIKYHVEIVDFLIEYKKTYKLYQINEEIIKKLLIKTSDGVYPIEKYINNKEVMPELIKLSNEPEKIIDICSKHNKYELLKEVNQNVLLYELEDGYTLLQDLCSKDIIPEALLNVPKNIDFVNYLRKNNFYEYLKDSQEEVLLFNVSNKKTLLEEILDKGFTPKLNYQLYEDKTIKILYDANRLDLITDVYDKLLLKSAREVLKNKKLKKNVTLLEYMLDNGYNPVFETYGITNEEIIKILCEKGYYDLLGEKTNYKKLSMDINGVQLLDILLEKSSTINFEYGGFTSIDIAKKALEKNRLDILCKANLKLLLEKANENNSYLDFILDAIKNKKIKYNLLAISFSKCSADDVAKFYLNLAKKDMITYINSLKENDLFVEYKRKTLLDALLDLDSGLTLDKIIKDDVKSKMRVAIILKSRGLDQKEIDIPLEEKEFSNEYLNDYKNKLGIGPILNEGEYLLNKLNSLFIKDGQSDMNLVSALISGYRHSLLLDYKTNIKELRNLVQLKERNIDKLIYQKTEEGAFFRLVTGNIYSENAIVNTLLHETGHAFHSYLANNKVPDNYEEVVERVRSNQEVLNKVEMYANKCNEIKEKINFILEEKYKFFFESYYNPNKVKEIEEFLNKSKEEQKQKFKDLNISEEDLDLILNESFKVEEYLDHQKRIFIEQYSDSIIRSEYGSFMSIGDILDAIYEGDLNSGVLKNAKGEKIKRTMGHGISYYLNTNHGFDEMIADFSTLYKSTDSKDMLNLLKSIVGDELFNMLSEFYYDNIVNSDEIKESKSL